MDPQFRNMLVQTITVSTVATLGVGGAPTFSTAQTSYRARVVNVNKFVHDMRGQGASVAYEVWVDSTGILSPGSKYTLPDGATPPVVRIDVYPDQRGNYHNKIMFGRS